MTQGRRAPTARPQASVSARCRFRAWSDPEAPSKCSHPLSQTGRCGYAVLDPQMHRCALRNLTVPDAVDVPSKIMTKTGLTDVSAIIKRLGEATSREVTTIITRVTRIAMTQLFGTGRGLTPAQLRLSESLRRELSRATASALLSDKSVVAID